MYIRLPSCHRPPLFFFMLCVFVGRLIPPPFFWMSLLSGGGFSPTDQFCSLGSGAFWFLFRSYVLLHPFLLLFACFDPLPPPPSLLELLASVCGQNLSLFFLIFPFFQMKCIFSVNVKNGAIQGRTLHFPLSSKDTISSPRSLFPPLPTLSDRPFIAIVFYLHCKTVCCL